MKYYTYLWLREDGTPYYAGKGCGYRAFVKGRHITNPPPKERIVVQEWPDEEIALAMEMYLIDFYGRKDIGTGCLRNRTDGGDSPLSPSVDVRARISNTLKLKGIKPPSRKGIKHSDESKEAIAKSSKERGFSDAFKTGRSNHARKPKPHLLGNKHGIGHKHTKEALEKISDAAWRRHHITIV